MNAQQMMDCLKHRADGKSVRAIPSGEMVAFEVDTENGYPPHLHFAVLVGETDANKMYIFVCSLAIMQAQIKYVGNQILRDTQSRN